MTQITSKFFVGFFALLFLSFYAHKAEGQKLIPDTIYVDFRGDSLIRIKQLNFQEIIDNRDENPHFIRYTTNKKFLLIPVDAEVFTHDSLSGEFLKWLTIAAPGEEEYSLVIDQFSIVEKEGKLSKSLYLVADIHLYKGVGDSIEQMGTFYYDYKYFPKAKNESVTESTENILAEWSRDFKLNLLTLNAVSAENTIDLTPNFIRDSKANSLYLNTHISSFVGMDWYGFQGEIYFSRPETNPQMDYSTGIIRYQNNPDYQSYAIGSKSTHRMWRKSESFIFDVDFNILLGFCKWKDMEKHDPSLYQLFDIEVSSIQSLVYSPINRRGIILRGGIIENFSYVYDKKPKFQIGLFLGIGVKI